MHKRWNISILVIFVLLASSLLGILSMNFVQQMMKQSAIVHSYYKAYYLSQAGLEFWLSAISVRGIGFEYAIDDTSALVRDNFATGTKLSLSISGMSSLLSKDPRQGSGCEHPYILSGGQSIIVPLFRDHYVGDAEGIFSQPVSGQNLADAFKQDKITFESVWFQGKLIFTALLLSGQDIYENGSYSQPGTMDEGLSPFRESFENYYRELDLTIANGYANGDFPYTMYLLISNSDTTEQSFCLVATDEYILPTDTFFLKSQASFGNQQVALDASYAQPIPGFLFNTYSPF